MRAQDVMTSPVVAVTADVPIRQVAALLADRGFTAVPVVDAAERLVGIVSEEDVVRGGYVEGATTAGGVMTTPVLCVDPDAPVAMIARVMLEDHVRWLPIVSDHRLVGVVTRRDLLGALARTGRP
ncbi:A-adding tRNA nucleotidyltransferase [Actinosynnema sp. ALI-1.44]